jgi:hypothetical protein
MSMLINHWLPRLSSVFVFLCCLVPAVALAHGPHAHKKKPRGTIFVAEAAAGALIGTGFPEGGAGYALRTTLGVGGAFRGFPIRFYGIGVVRYGGLNSTVQTALQTSDLTRGLLDISGGLRILVPLKRFRFLGEVTLGSSSVASTTSINGGLERYESSSSRFSTYLATGVQYRAHRHLSIGFMAEWSLPSERDSVDVIGSISGAADTGQLHSWTALTGTVVGHF